MQLTNDMDQRLVATALLIGTIVGAGFLGIPFVVARSGFLLGLAHIAIIGAAVCMLTLYLAEIALRTRKNHQLPGYALLYLGTTGKRLMLTATFIGIYSALTAYLIGQGQSLSMFFTGSLQYAFPALLAAWFIFACITHRKKDVGKSETIGVALMILLMLVIIAYYAPQVKMENLTTFSLQNVFLPFGVILFAFLGFSAVPEMKSILGRNAIDMKKIIIRSFLLIAALYTLFTFIVLGTHGMQTPQVATLALAKPFMLLGIITLSTAYLALTLALIDTLVYDYKRARKTAWLLANIIPLVLVFILTLFNKAYFTFIMGVGGILSGIIIAVLILAMLPRARRKGDFIASNLKQAPYSRLFAFILTLLFVGCALVELIALFR